MKGMVFDIQRCSLHDGPGIRTTVFLKGCPLRCTWCSNPESLKKERELGYRAERCIQCHACTEVCESGALSAHDGRLRVDHSRCTACGNCLDVCPSDALKIYGYETSPGKIMEILIRDKAYYDQSGGGITLSGGEVLLQAGFAREILKLAAEAGLHTCIETSGAGSTGAFEKLLPFTDLFLFDYKLSDGGELKKHCGAELQVIHRNLAFLSARSASIHLRCPLIPGINDTPEHFEAIRKLKESYPAIQQIEILPYHNYGEHKYAQLGRENDRPIYPKPTAEKLEQWKKGVCITD